MKINRIMIKGLSTTYEDAPASSILPVLEPGLIPDMLKKLSFYGWDLIRGREESINIIGSNI